MPIFFSPLSFFFELQMSPPSFGQNKTRATHNHSGGGGVISFSPIFFLLLSFLLSFFLSDVLYLNESIPTHTPLT